MFGHQDVTPSAVTDTVQPTVSATMNDDQSPAFTDSMPGAETVPAPLVDLSTSPTEQPSVVTETVTASAPPSPLPSLPAGAVDDDLLAIKQQALQQLSPLVDHLEQTPEERFRTTMMMIQASDDHSLIKPAYEAAQAIEDHKLRAQALLDVVNEINYFTRGADQ